MQNFWPAAMPAPHPEHCAVIVGAGEPQPVQNLAVTFMPHLVQGAMLSASAQGQQRQDWTGSPVHRTDVRKNKKERGATEEQRGCAVLEQTLIWTQLCGSASAFDIIRSCDRQEAITGSEQARWASARACMYGRKAAVEELKNMGADTVYERRQTVFL